MDLHLFNTPKELGQAAGKKGASLIKKAIHEKGFANIILATGTSQFETIQYLISSSEIKWENVQMFHLDEYIGLSDQHKASFRNYLKGRFIQWVPKLKKAYLIDGEVDATLECKRLGGLILENPIDVAFVGIGENGHLAFNDPPADFDTENPYIVVALDQACRAQQWGEGWFETLEEVPQYAISMSIRQIMKSNHIICSVPDERKAKAVRECLTLPVSSLFPASMLQNHADCHIYLDTQAATLLPSEYK